MVVDSVRPDPASPSPRQAVRFISVVRNAGNASTPSGTVIGVGYFVDRRYVTYGVSGNGLAPGASVTITTQGGLWTATSGNHTLRALVDDVNRFAESNETNDARSMSLAVGSGGCSICPISTPNDRWKLEIFNNRTLSGSPVEIRTAAAGGGGFIFNWGNGRASNCTGNDIGVRWVRIEYKWTDVDVVAVHPDGQRAPDNWPNPSWGFGNMSDLFDNYLAYGVALRPPQAKTPIRTIPPISNLLTTSTDRWRRLTDGS